MLCLPKQIRDHLIENLKDGSLDLEALAKLPSSEARRAALEPFVGTEAAEPMTALLEKKLLMKNQQDGLISFVRDAIGDRPTVQKDLISRINKIDTLLTPDEESKYYESLVSEKLGTRTTYEQAADISKLSKEFQAAAADPNSGLKYGASKVVLSNYMNDLKLENAKVGFKETLGNMKSNPLGTTVKMISKISGYAKGIKASLDDSAIFRQGWKTLFTNPQIWAKNASQSFVDIAKQLGKDASDNTILDGVKAEILSRPNGRSGLYEKMGLDIGNLEEAFPTSLPEKIPLFNRLYKASETAYTSFLYRMRSDIADKLVAKAQSAGLDMGDPLQAKSIGTLINSLTGRGNLGSYERVGKQINTILFSPKMLKSNIDFLTAHLADTTAPMSTFARKEAGMNLIKVLSGITTVLGIAHALDPKSVETDPRSADFGKIRIGDTRFDVSGGMGSLVTLAMREITQSSKSSTTHKVTPLNSGKFGSQTGMDVLVNFSENKLAPAASLFKDILNQKDFSGQPLTLLPSAKNKYQGEAMNFLAPLGIQNALEVLQSPNGANAAITIMADALGINTNTYSLVKKAK